MVRTISALASSTCETRTGPRVRASSSRFSRLRSETLRRMRSAIAWLAPFSARASERMSMPRSTRCVSRSSSLTMSAKVNMRDRMSSARALSRSSMLASSAFSTVAPERAMIDERFDAAEGLRGVAAREAPGAGLQTRRPRSRSPPATRCPWSRSRGRHRCGSGRGALPARPPRGRWAGARARGRRSAEARRRAGSPAVPGRRSRGTRTTSSSTSNPTLPSTAAARSAPNEASSRPAARSRPPRAGGRCPVAIRWNCPSA